jgi:hypothetical protein
MAHLPRLGRLAPALPLTGPGGAQQHAEGAGLSVQLFQSCPDRLQIEGVDQGCGVKRWHCGAHACNRNGMAAWM